MKGAISWFELPVEDLERARRFYETVLGTTLGTQTVTRIPMAFLPGANGASGALVKDARFRPGADGAVIYLDAGSALGACIARVEAAGGKLVVPETDIGEHGRFAILLDTEGNRVGLHDRANAAPGRR